MLSLLGRFLTKYFYPQDHHTTFEYNSRHTFLADFIEKKLSRELEHMIECKKGKNIKIKNFFQKGKKKQNENQLNIWVATWVLSGHAPGSAVTCDRSIGFSGFLSNGILYFFSNQKKDESLSYTR